MRIIPVLDLKAGRVVRGMGGRRSEYAPISSTLVASSLPLDVAQAFRDHFGFDELYVADLDAIGGAPPALATFAALSNQGFRLWVDSGVRESQDAAILAGAGIEKIILGLETITGPSVLGSICEALGPEGIVFSLDLKAGQPVGDLREWDSPAPLDIAAQAIEMGVETVILLDLAKVGSGSGTGTEDLCKKLTARHPHVEIVAGGGVKDFSDLLYLCALGLGAVLVASALHDGRLRPEELARLRNADERENS